MLWAESPGTGEKGPAAMRSKSLAEGASADFFSAGLRWEEVILLEGRRLPPEKLAAILERLRRGRKNLLLRLEWPLNAGASRPITPAEAAAWRAGDPLFVHFQMHHPREWSQAFREQANLLADAGLPLSAEILLERGVNDDPSRLKKLLEELARVRVRPYYLVDGAWLPDKRRIPSDAALETVRAIRGWISGIAVPQFMREGLDGRRTLVIPDYIKRVDEEGLELENYKGENYHCPHPRPWME